MSSAVHALDITGSVRISYRFTPVPVSDLLVPLTDVICKQELDFRSSFR